MQVQPQQYIFLHNRLLHYMLYICECNLCVYVDLRVKCLYLTVNLCFLSSLNSGTDRESPNNVEKPPNRKPPVKKPRLPQNRNKSLDLSGTCLCFYLCLCVQQMLQNLTQVVITLHTKMFTLCFFTLQCTLQHAINFCVDSMRHQVYASSDLIFPLYRQHRLFTWSQRAVVIPDKFTCCCPAEALP